jgi:hypothetical protein
VIPDGSVPFTNRRSPASKVTNASVAETMLVLSGSVIVTSSSAIGTGAVSSINAVA